ncbi:uncharacterized protein [Notothenia coriiceps]|uniref:Uncharacterized protein n=1 Tax=Notothenia coriiceps TaxID=8208 RepID=A0A6I9PPS9_9TELE|nr:PREDICTED: uncharacterized protein LOC104963327 [Notothenia coriiceps]
MLCCESGIMRKNWDNPLALSSKKTCQGQKDYGRELQRLRAVWEAEKKHTQRARGEISVELRHLREGAEREQQRAVKELLLRRGCKTDCRANNKVNIKDSRRHTEVESTDKEAFCLCGGETYTKLQQLLLTLYEKINGEQAVYKLHHRQEFEVEKAVFLCHLLDAHGRLLQGRQRAGQLSSISNSLSRSQGGGTNSYQTKPLLTCSRALPHTASHSQKKNTKQDLRELPSGRAVCAADPCPSTAVVDTCQSGSLTICHPHSAPHAGLDHQPPYCAESSGSDESSPPKCMDRNMEPEPAPAHTDMESHEEDQALGQQQSELTRPEEQDKQNGLVDKAVPTTTNITTTSLLGKRHHSLYANLNGFEVEGVRKVIVKLKAQSELL